MITLDDVCRIKAVLIAHGEWIDADYERARVTEDGVFEWITSSCGGSAIAALIADGFSVYIWPSIRYQGFLKIRIDF
mgnify:CR=1 FL=1